MDTIVPLPLETGTLAFLLDQAKDFAIVHGLVICDTADQQQVASHVLLPSPIIRKRYIEAVEVAKDFNELYHKVANDYNFLRDALKSVLAVDSFTKGLWNIYETVRNEGIAQPINLGIVRSDYMVEYDHKDSQNNVENGVADVNGDVNDSNTRLRQVEYNTIATGAAGLSTQVAKLHRYLASEMELEVKLLENNPVSGTASGIVEAWQMYGNERAVVVFVIYSPNPQVYDRRWLEYAVYELNSRIKIISCTIHDMSEAVLTKDKKLFMKDREVGVVYFRSVGSPRHFTSNEVWETRLNIERSMAIKCPNINFQLSGTKKVQQELTKPGVVERYIKDPNAVQRIRATFAQQFNLEQNEEGDNALRLGIEKPEGFVLKPQREGGGNNFFGDDIKELLSKIKDSDERTQYVLMERIRPLVFKNYVVWEDKSVALCDMVSELGIYGVIMGTPDRIIMNTECGHLVRTKTLGTNEEKGRRFIDIDEIKQHVQLHLATMSENGFSLVSQS
ncbi:unnamed protein product [Owenia fusiformis]|uniref:Glutathione synthetase n=1 Tax=Owenia fusiformis TaxID=6347 RepID=A0A8J1USW0_OWEFU|nr:unnamed protein product [Owenia fusiformis]